jgi:GNAT superfamily N-acetyltransferase
VTLGRRHDDSEVEIVALTRERYLDAVTATSRAFWPDPMFGFFARSPLQEHTMLPHFVGAVMGDALRHGEVHAIVEGNRVVASASWLSPGDAPRPWRREMRVSARCAWALVRGRNRVRGLRILDQMAKHHPTEPHWYLALLGVDPSRQRTGLGGRLLRHALERCDADGVGAYLETQKPENVPFYSRHGFTVSKEITVPGCPTVWLMWRDPGG